MLIICKSTKLINVSVHKHVHNYQTTKCRLLSCVISLCNKLEQTNKKNQIQMTFLISMFRRKTFSRNYYYKTTNIT